ncbi:AMP-binding protein [Streptomyces sp. I05A-00742]|uniref:acyl-CoA synthetase n=1 Tax=Streptomyces sp. I05A-00742 TaxID=2732853 RepID=UPI0014881E40|nr:AMP-binding protein [Streptomyces sp. I05A-00742]
MTAALLSSLAGGDVPDRPDALSFAGRVLSRERLLGAAGAVAHRISGAAAVAVHATATAETAVAVVGGLLAGVPVVPLPPDAGPVEREHILRDSGAELVLGAAGEGVDVPVDLRERADHPVPAGDPERAALILYTSGTTGAPKGVLMPHGAIAACLDGLADVWQWTAEDTLVHGLPLFHVHGLVLGVLGALRTGCRLVHTGRPSPEAYAAAGGSLYFGVPTVWSRIARDPSSARRLGGARLLVSGSAALPAPVFRELEALTGQRPVERYGMTETLITVAARPDGERLPGRVGVPLPGTRTRLAAVEDGSGIGELEVSGPTLFSGYLGRPEETARAHTADGWFRTGDIAALDPDGGHRIVGRASTDLIKSGGYRIGAGEVENALLDHPAVAEAAVVGVPHDDLGQEIVAYVVADGVTEQALIDFVAAQLSVHKRPRRVRFLDALPRNAMGKPQKRLLEGR